MSRRRARGRSKARRVTSSAWLVVLLVFDVLMGAYLFDTQGFGLIVVALIITALIVAFGRSVKGSRRRH